MHCFFKPFVLLFINYILAHLPMNPWIIGLLGQVYNIIVWTLKANWMHMCNTNKFVLILRPTLNYHYLYEGTALLDCNYNRYSKDGNQSSLPNPPKHPLSYYTGLSHKSNDGINTIYLPMRGIIVKSWIPKKWFYIREVPIPSYSCLA